MNKLWAAGGGALLVAILTYLWNVLKPLITPQMISDTLIIVGIMLAMAISGWMTSWISTQMYKITFAPDPFPSNEHDARIWRRKLYLISWITAIPGAVAVEVVALLFHLDHSQWVVMAVLGALWCFLIVGTSPFVWRLIFMILIPSMMRLFGGVKVERDPNTGQITSVKDESDPNAKTQFIKPPEDKT